MPYSKEKPYQATHSTVCYFSSSFEFRVRNFEFRVGNSSFELTFRVSSKDFRVSSKDFRVSSKDFRVSSKDFRVSSKDFRVSSYNFLHRVRIFQYRVQICQQQVTTFKCLFFHNQSWLQHSTLYNIQVGYGGGYSTLAWTGVCHQDLGTLTHV